MNNKIDIVILWVDDSDKKWKKKKSGWQDRYGIKNKMEERYRDWENLIYLFRGIEKYMPWYNHVYLVTDNQKPVWLNEKFEKITVVDHKEIIDKDALPTFNSHAIELNIHNIPNLSENFIYFNDDIFVTEPTQEEDFFINNIPVDTGILNINHASKNGQVQKIIVNNLGLINENFNVRKTMLKKPLKWLNFRYGISLINNILLLRWFNFANFSNHHLTISFNKKTFIEIWNQYSSELSKTINNKFRTSDDYSVWLMRYWQLASNNFIPRSQRLGETIQIKNKDDANKCKDLILNSKYKIICINDNESTKDFEQVKKIVNRALKKKLTSKSKFEL